jgi:hypothetical protein
MFALALIAYSVLLLQGKPAGSSIEPPAGAQLLLQAEGEGAQVYACTDQHWVLKAPEAKLLDQQHQVVGLHSAGPTWRLEDGSEVKGKMIATQPSPNASAIPWLLVQAVPGSASGKLAKVGYIQRTETEGGVAPAGACTGGEQRVPYKAKYSFYIAQ